MVPPLPEVASAGVRDKITCFIPHKLSVTIDLETYPAPVHISFVFTFIVDNIFEHGHRCRIKRTLSPACLANHHLNLRNGFYPPVQLLQNFQVVFNTCMRHGCGHKQEAALVERRHKLPSQTRESMVQATPYTSGTDINPRIIQTPGHKTENSAKTHPYIESEKQDHNRYSQEYFLVIKKPHKNLRIEIEE